MDKLKPCPFCGGEAEIRTRMDENIWDHSQVTWQAVSCGNLDCSCQGFDWPKDAQPNAVELWNTRPTSPAEAAKVGEAALYGLFDRRGIKQVLSEIKDDDPEIWAEIVAEAGHAALRAIADRG